MNTKKSEMLSPFVELAEVALRVARKLRGYPLQKPEIVALSQLECLVLLHVKHRPGVPLGENGEELRFAQVTPARLCADWYNNGSCSSDQIRWTGGTPAFLFARAQRSIETVHNNVARAAGPGRFVQPQYSGHIAHLGTH